VHTPTFLMTSFDPGTNEDIEHHPSTGRRIRSYVLPVLGGATAGALATGPMTLFMMAAHRYLPLHQRHSLPPKAITMDLLSKVNLKQHMTRKQRKWAPWIAHVAYGTGVGATYGSFSRFIPLPPPIKGIIFALLVWAGSYLGWLPAFDVSGSAPDEPMRRNVLMIGAHVVYGAVIGPVAAWFERQRTQA
jgi:putative membrane protein